jgi:small-conductance mechanosensitive channel
MRHCIAVFLLATVWGQTVSATLADSAALRQTLAVDTTRKAPVVLGHDTLFFFDVGTKGFSADRRAEMVTERLRETAEETWIPVDSIRVTDADLSADILVADRHLLSVYDIDASMARSSRLELAERQAGVIREAVTKYREARSGGILLRGILLSLGATVLLIVLLRVLAVGRRRLEDILGARIKGIRLETNEVIPADWLRSLARVLIRILRWIIVVILLYVYFEFVLTRFVWTRALAEGLLSLTLDPLRMLGNGFVAYLPNLFFLLVLFFVVRLAVRFLRYVFKEIERGAIGLPGFYADWAIPTFKIVRVLVIAFALVVAFPYIPGSNSPAFQGISIFLGVLFSLGSTSAVANGVAGLILTYMRSFKVGDIVKIQETVGKVVGSDLLVTRIRTPKNVDVTIPNASVLGTHVINYSVQAKEGKLILHTSVTIGYDTPWRQVHALLLMAAERTEGVQKDPQPFVLQTALNDFYVTYELNAYTVRPERMSWIYSGLHTNIQDAFNEYGVQIMSPNYMFDRDKPTYVPKARWFEAPAKKPDEADSGG